MPDLLLYEYAVIRVVPRVEREEFLNIGVVLYCRSQQFLHMLYMLDESRIRTLCPATDLADLSAYLESFVNICNASKDAGPIGKLPVAQRFRWLTATRSTVIQVSKVHPGLCADPGNKLEQLFRELVL